VAGRPPVVDANGHVLGCESDIRKHLAQPRGRGTTLVGPGDQAWDQGLLGVASVS
jgi:hypothetical protein